MAEDCCSFQLISGDGVLNMEGLENFSRTTNLSQRGVSYSVVAIMGPQSSGKSTLLNKLFQTDFRMMDADDERGQTTRGIWIAKAIGIEPFTIAVDVEGSDSGERGQDGATFEKQSALFAFGIADTVIINTWCHDIGREHAASRPLLKTVFEAMTRSFRSSKTNLLFVLRDQTRTPLELLQRLLRQDIEKVWAAIADADAHKRTPLDEFFNVEITALPSYEFEEKKFTEQVARLRQRFFLSTSLGGLAGDRKDDQPASGLPLRAQQIWKTIKKNKNLDLPPPQVMAATVRCQQIAKEKLREALKSGPVSEFGERLSSILEDYLCQYDMEAINYEESIRNENWRELEAKALKVVRPAYDAMLKHLRSIALESLKTRLERTVKEVSGDGFEAAVDLCSQSIMRQFERGCEVNVRESLRRDIETLKSEKKAEYEELIKSQKIKKHVSKGSGILVGVGVVTSLVAIGCDQVTAVEVGLAASTFTKRFQLISGEGVLNMEGLENFSRTTNLSQRGVSYSVVAIMGPQSSGKSTLLNKLFQTDFRMMDADDGRTQTTRGIWIAKAIGIEPFTIAIDLEGSDSGERGQDGATFEKQSAVFAFAIADTVIINMWCHDIGREHAASMPLLKTVFEAMARSFRSSKTSLLFVLREPTMTPLELLQRLLRQDIEKIWAAMADADAHKRTHLEEFFNVEITALPSYESEEEQFTEQVARLRQRFFLSTSLGGFAGDRKDGQPASGLPLRAQQIWKTIKKNKDLDLPPHQVMVATFRCEEIAKEQLSRLKMDETWLAMGEALKSGPVSEFGETLSSILEDYLYQNENRRKLEAKALKVVRPAYVAMLQHLRSIALEGLKTLLERTVKEESGDGFEAAVDSCCQSIRHQFERGCEDATIRQVNDWVHLEENVRENLRRNMETIKSKKKAEHEELIKAQKIKKRISEGAGILMGIGVETSLIFVGCDQVTATAVALAASTSTKRLIGKLI
ncbi:hypothetical protein SADUNF_Sadunf12G0091200 [Salix dunnii]|uniref:GB1/RHD3-type G domain-containing protein n=1 Tax=Salix dunnii TaxID=1413687 RepID=A0A835MMA9_9ROSI|nr:hypothetical protein SADUNF_Sadunf12G0091200 [Salix dunnii]